MIPGEDGAFGSDEGPNHGGLTDRKVDSITFDFSASGGGASTLSFSDDAVNLAIAEAPETDPFILDELVNLGLYENVEGDLDDAVVLALANNPALLQSTKSTLLRQTDVDAITLPSLESNPSHPFESGSLWDEASQQSTRLGETLIQSGGVEQATTLGLLDQHGALTERGGHFLPLLDNDPTLSENVDLAAALAVGQPSGVFGEGRLEQLGVSSAPELSSTSGKSTRSGEIDFLLKGYGAEVAYEGETQPALTSDTVQQLADRGILQPDGQGGLMMSPEGKFMHSLFDADPNGFNDSSNFGGGSLWSDADQQATPLGETFIRAGGSTQAMSLGLVDGQGGLTERGNQFLALTDADPALVENVDLAAALAVGHPEGHFDAAQLEKLSFSSSPKVFATPEAVIPTSEVDFLIGAYGSEVALEGGAQSVLQSDTMKQLADLGVIQPDGDGGLMLSQEGNLLQAFFDADLRGFSQLSAIDDNCGVVLSADIGDLGMQLALQSVLSGGVESIQSLLENGSLTPELQGDQAIPDAVTGVDPEAPSELALDSLAPYERRDQAIPELGASSEPEVPAELKEDPLAAEALEIQPIPEPLAGVGLDVPADLSALFAAGEPEGFFDAQRLEQLGFSGEVISGEPGLLSTGEAAAGELDDHKASTQETTTNELNFLLQAYGTVGVQGAEQPVVLTETLKQLVPLGIVKPDGDGGIVIGQDGKLLNELYDNDPKRFEQASGVDSQGRVLLNRDHLLEKNAGGSSDTLRSERQTTESSSEQSESFKPKVSSGGPIAPARVVTTMTPPEVLAVGNAASSEEQIKAGAMVRSGAVERDNAELADANTAQRNDGGVGLVLTPPNVWASAAKGVGTDLIIRASGLEQAAFAGGYEGLDIDAVLDFYGDGEQMDVDGAIASIFDGVLVVDPVNGMITDFDATAFDRSDVTESDEKDGVGSVAAAEKGADALLREYGSKPV